MNDALSRLYQVVRQRKESPAEGSYTCYLLNEGLDKILKKVGEESTETVIAVKNGVRERTVEEVSDLLYHLLVLLVHEGIPLEDVAAELDRRSAKIGNLKQFHASDHNS